MIIRLEMSNCGPFRGEHSITLGEGAYAIVATHEEDATRSNGVGKSFILEMIDYAITGKLNSARGYTADGWISNGEREASVSVTFEGGARITRSKRRGQSTQVRFTRPGFEEAAQDGASAGVLEFLAMSADDFRNAAYFEQRKMAKLVDPEQTKPSDRLEIVSGWFGLGLAERAEERAGELAADHEKKLTRSIAERDALRSRYAEEPESIDIDQLTAESAVITAKLESLRTTRRAMRMLEKHMATVEAQAQRIAKGKELRDKLAETQDVSADADSAREEIAKHDHIVESCAEEVRRRKKTALGLFDGACPVAPITCPVKDKINANRSGTEKALTDARTALAKAGAARDALVEKCAPLIEAERAYQQLQFALDRMREEVRSNTDLVKEAKSALAHGGEPNENIEEDIRIAEDRLREVLTSIGIAKADKQGREKNALATSVLDIEIARSQKTVALHLKARAIFRTAQRRVAERNLSFVEREANYQLSDAGIDLSVTARWEREASGPAKTCEECGAAFPSSAKIKVCDRCGVARGSHTVQRLDFMLSDRSGALNDLGGVAMQLAAGSWLLGTRHSPFATLMMDEPFSACDGHNRKALAVQLLKLISRGTWRQTLIISHSPDTVDLYPNKIVIIAHADGTRSIEQ